MQNRKRCQALRCCIKMFNIHPKHDSRLCPRQFGHPNRRLRVWRILYNKKEKVWNAKWSLSELVDLLLAPMECQLKLGHMAFLWATQSELESYDVREGQLTRQNATIARACFQYGSNAIRICSKMLLFLPCLISGLAKPHLQVAKASSGTLPEALPLSGLV